MMVRRRYELTDVEWSIIGPLLPNKPRGVPRVDDRRVLNGILWRFRTGSPWAEMPDRYGPSTTCYNRFVRWRKAGVWDRLLTAVSAAFEGAIVMIDSTCVRVHQHGATGKKGEPGIAAWDGPEAASRARSMPSLTLVVVPSPCA
jgi:transposase